MNAFLSLSPKFQAEATKAAALSYRRVFIKAFYQKPDSADFIEEFSHEVPDKIEAGLDAIILIRAGMENPELIRSLMPYLSELNKQHILPGQLPYLIKKMEEKYTQPNEDFLNPALERKLEERTNELLTAATKIIESYPQFFRIDFKKAALERLNLVPTKNDNIQKLTEAKFSSPLKGLRRTTEFFENWICDVEAALNYAAISAVPVINNTAALLSAHEYLEKRYSKLHSTNPQSFVLN